MSDTSQPASGELIIYQGRLHWAIYVRPLMFTCIALTLFGYDQPFLGAAAMIASGLFWAAAIMAAANARLIITERRVLISAGAVFQLSLDLPLAQVERVRVDQDTMGRLLGYGTLVVDGQDGSRVACPRVAHAAEFDQQLRAALGAA